MLPNKFKHTGDLMQYLLIFFLINISLFAQKGYWNAITPIKKIERITEFEGEVFGASRGGVFRLKADGSGEYITRGSGLGGVNALDVFRNQNELFAITANSGLTSFQDDEWTVAESVDISNWQRLFATGEDVWISYDTGVIVYRKDATAWNFRDFFNQFPEDPEGLVQPIIYRNLIYLFSENGVLVAPEDYINNNLKNIQNWEHKEILPSGEILVDFAFYSDELILSTSANIYRLTVDDSLIKLDPDHPLEGGSNIYSGNGQLYCRAGNALYQLLDMHWAQISALPGTYMDFVEFNGEFVFSCTYADLSIHNAQSGITDTLQLERPLGARYRQFAKAPDGTIYAATSGLYGTPPDRAAFFKEGKWYDLRVGDSHFAQFGFGNSIISIVMSNTGEAIWGTYGRGIYIQRGTTDFELINRSGTNTAQFLINNSSVFVENDPSFNDYLGYVNTFTDTTFTIVQDMINDDFGNIWLTNHQAQTFKGLICVKSEKDGSFSLDHSNWLYWDMRIPFSGSIATTTIGVVASDAFGRIWVGTKAEGVAVLNYSNTLEDQSDDSWRKYSTREGLSSSRIHAIASDLNGTIYIGTDNGVDMISGTTVFNLKGDYAPKGSRINDIERDGKGNLWFATDIGVSMLLADENAFDPKNWVHYTTANSGLIEDFCNGLYIDNENEIIYIGTDLGISELHSPYLVNALGNKQTLTIGPNPFRPAITVLTISGIEQNAVLRVLNVNGALIREFGREEIIAGVVTWDGKNKHNQEIASGVYVLLAVNDEGKIQTAKVMIFR